MMPSARTPTRSKRWTTALRRKRLGRRMMLRRSRSAPRRGSRAGRPACARPRPSIRQARQARERRNWAVRGGPGSDGRHRRPGRAIAGLRATAPTTLAPRSRIGAIDQPRADRVHFLDPAQVDRQRVGQGIDLALGRSGARDRQRAAHAVNIARGLAVACTRPSVERSPLSLVVTPMRRKVREIGPGGKRLRHPASFLPTLIAYSRSQ